MNQLVETIVIATNQNNKLLIEIYLKKAIKSLEDKKDLKISKIVIFDIDPQTFHDVPKKAEEFLQSPGTIIILTSAFYPNFLDEHENYNTLMQNQNVKFLRLPLSQLDIENAIIYRF